MQNKKILITGASGFVGRSVCAELLKQNLEIRLALRANNFLLENAEVAIINQIDNDTDWSTALRNVDVVIHLAARVHVMNEAAVDSMLKFRSVNVDGTMNLARQSVKAGVRRFIFISSIKVNGEQTTKDKPFTEDDVANPQDAYGLSKLEAEQGLLQLARETKIEVVIIRPPLVYGAGVRANFLSMLRAVKKGYPLPLGVIYNKRSFVYVENLVSLILRCINHPAAANEVFLVSDGYDLSTTELLQKCAFAIGVKPKLIPVPPRVLELIASLTGKKDVIQRLCGNLQVDITKANKLLGWVPPISLEDGMRKTVRNLL